MKPLSKEEIEASLKKLPEDLQDAFFSPEVAENIQEIGRKFDLTVIKMGELYSETNGVMLGLTPPKDYIKNLAAGLGVDQTKAKEIAGEVNQKIFQSVRESLKKIHGLAEPEPASPSLCGEKKALKPEIIMPTGNKISIKSDREEMEKIDVSEDIPMMQKVFAKKIEPKPPSLVFAKTPQVKSIDEMLDNLGGRPAPAVPKPPVPKPPVPKPPESNAAIKSGIEKILGGEIRQGTVSPQVIPTKSRNDPYREQI